MSIEVFVDPQPPNAHAGSPITFTVNVRDPDASPIREGACGNGNGVSFGDAGSAPNSCSAACASTGSRNASPATGSATFSYTHTYASPGRYSVTMVYASGACDNPYHSVNHITFPIDIS
jgi:hypothetical protein